MIRSSIRHCVTDSRCSASIFPNSPMSLVRQTNPSRRVSPKSGHSPAPARAGPSILASYLARSPTRSWRCMRTWPGCRSRGVRNELTRLLAGGKSASDAREPRAASTTFHDQNLAGGRLDDLLDIRDQYAVLPTDFSQLRAIEQARQGGSLVIHGPPGTGKSQTIANLVATLLRRREACPLCQRENKRP